MMHSSHTQYTLKYTLKYTIEMTICNYKTIVHMHGMYTLKSMIRKESPTTQDSIYT